MTEIGRDPLSYMGIDAATQAQVNAGLADDTYISPLTLDLNAASTTESGVVRLATVAESITGTAVDIANTPAGLAAVAIAGAPNASTLIRGIIELATDGEATARVDSERAVVPSNLTAVLAEPPAIGGTTAGAVTCTNFSASGTFALTGDDVQVTEGGTGLGTSVLGDLLLGDAANSYELLNIGATPRQLFQVNAGGTTAEWSSNIDIPGTLDVAGAVVFDSTLLVSGAMTFDDSVVITGTLQVDGLLTCNASATILTAGTALNLGSDNDAAAVNLGVGTTARAIGIGNSAAAHTITIGSLTLGASVLIQAGTGNFAITPVATSTITIGAATTTGTITLGQSTAAGGQNIDIGNAINTGAQVVSIASGAAAANSTVNIFSGIATAGTQTLNMATGASATAVNIGNTTAGTAVAIDSGTGGLALTTTGAALLSLTSGATLTLDAVGALDINSSGAAINIGNDGAAFAINVGTGGAARTITLGNTTGATDVIFNSGTGGFAFNPTGAGDITFNVTAGNFAVVGGGNSVGIGNDAANNTVTVGSTNGTAVTVIQSGTGDVNVTSTDEINLDAVGVLQINSSAAAISIGSDADAFALNLGTGGAARTITLGNVTGATDVIFNSGTGGFAFNPTGVGDITFNVTAGDFAVVGGGNSIGIGDDAANNTVTVGSTNGTAATIIQSGTGDVVVTSTDDITIDSAGVLELNSSAGVIGIGSDADAFGINIGTGAAARTITMGNITGATALLFNAGTGGVAFATTGAGDISLNSTDQIVLDSDGVLELNSSAGAISIANDAVALSVNVGTGAADMTVLVGSTNTASTTTIQAGSGEVILSPTSGAISMVPATNSVAGLALTINARLGVATFTGQTTGAAANEDFVITNSSLGSGDGVFVTVSNEGSNDADMTLEGVITETAGTLTIHTQNNGAAALNGDVIITFWIIN